jgi:hypothetical protein
MIPIPAAQIGGARVQRTFTMGDRRLRNGDVLTGDEVRSIRPANRSAFIDKGYIVPWPIEAVSLHVAQQPAEPVSRFIRPLGFGRGYDVIEGRKVNDEPLMTKEEAQALAGIELPPVNGDAGS